MQPIAAEAIKIAHPPGTRFAQESRKVFAATSTGPAFTAPKPRYVARGHRNDHDVAPPAQPSSADPARTTDEDDDARADRNGDGRRDHHPPADRIRGARRFSDDGSPRRPV